MPFKLPYTAEALAFLSSHPYLTPIGVAFTTDIFLAQFYEPATDLLLAIYTFANASLFYTFGGLKTFDSAIPIFFSLVAKNLIFWFSWFIFCSIRRIYFHPLSHLPGPKLRAITGLIETWDYIHGRNAKSMYALHAKYGPIVRIAPNDVNILTTESLPIIFPGRSATHNARGPTYYMGLIAGHSILHEMNPHIHRKSRKPWDHAFRPAALEGYATRVEHHVSKTIATTRALLDPATNNCEREMGYMLGGYAFDVMADLAFGVENYGMQDGTGNRKYLDLMHTHMNSAATIMSLRNVIDVLKYFPLVGDIKDFHRVEESMLADRAKLGIEARKDVYAELVRDEKGNPRPKNLLLGEMDLLIVAGAGEFRNRKN